jgi:hypothetical protein
VFGRGAAASVDLHLSGDTKVTFERFGDIAKGPALTAHLMSTLGVAKSFKATDAVLAGSLSFKLAKHHGDDTTDAAAREWGSEFLRLAATGDIDLNDQASRWRAFSALELLNPQRDAGEDRSAYSLASASVVLVAESGMRLVRCGWFLSYVRGEVGGIDPGAVATKMERVGWSRQGAGMDQGDVSRRPATNAQMALLHRAGRLGGPVSQVTRSPQVIAMRSRAPRTRISGDLR